MIRPKGTKVAEPNASWLSVIGRLKPRVSISQAKSDLSAIALQMDGSYPGRQTVLSVEQGAYLNGPQARSKGTFLAVAFQMTLGLVLLMACCNIMNLLLGRAAARHREVGVRLAIGASRLRLIQQLLTESLALALVGGGLGLWLAQALPPLLLRVISQPGVRPNLALDLHVFAYAGMMALASALIFGVVPALWATRLDLSTFMKNERMGPSRQLSGTKIRNGLVAAQVAGCLALLVVGALFVRGLQHAEAIDPGFATKDVVTVSMDLARHGYSPTTAATFYRDLLERVAAGTGSNDVGLTSALPLSGRRSTAVRIGALGTETTGTSLPTYYNVVSGGYFRAFQVPILRGRAFEDREVRPGRPTQAVVSETLARSLWVQPDHALSQQFHSGTTTYEVVGVARDVHNVDLSEADGPFFYAAATPDDALGMIVVTRVPGRASAVATEMAGLVQRIDKRVQIKAELFENRIADLTQSSRAAAAVAGWLSLFGLLLACVGVYGLIDYSVSQRTREMGVRMALGARPKDVVWLIVRQGMSPVLIGLTIGVLVAAAAAQTIKGLLFGVSSLDAVAYVVAIGILGAVALIAMTLPARRAAHVDPLIALRLE